MPLSPAALPGETSEAEREEQSETETKRAKEEGRDKEEEGGSCSGSFRKPGVKTW